MEDALDTDDEAVPKALLELLSAASVDKNCRAKILKVADGFLQECTQSSDTTKRALSGSILAKLSSVSTESGQHGVDLVRIFNDAYQSKNETALQSAVEGLAFSSTVAKTKDQLIKDPNFISVNNGNIEITRSGTSSNLRLSQYHRQFNLIQTTSHRRRETY